MLITWVLVIIPIAATQEAQSSEEKHNVTRLYPVANTIDLKYRKNHNENQSENTYNDTEEKTKDEISTKKNKGLTWKIDTVYQPNSTAGEDISSDVSEEQASRPKIELLSAERAVEEGKPEPKPENISEERLKTDKISEENPKQMSQDKPSKEISVDRSRTKSEEAQKSNSEEKEFRPSPHLGNFFDDENLNLLKFSSPGPVIPTKKKPNLDYISSKELYMLNYRRPGEQGEPPYRFQTSHSPKTPWNTLETRPTVESSVKIPAGGLYKRPDPFREKPSSDGEAGDFGLGFSEDDREKENPVKKRSNPWRGLVRVLTAFLPVGLLISALTPSVLTLHSTDNGPRGRLARRGDGGFAASEGCRRRLLCEIHADENYMRSPAPPLTRKHCYKFHCEDPHSLQRLLRWLLAHQSTAGHQRVPHHIGPQLQESLHTGPLISEHLNTDQELTRHTGQGKLGSLHTRPQDVTADYRDQASDDVLHYHHSSNDFT